MKSLEEIIKQLPQELTTYNIDVTIYDCIQTIANACEKRKGVYTVLVTLLYYKYLHPEQDIRLFQKRFKGGFSARSFDTKQVTPILKKLGLPSMSESGWLTRSLEQPYPYNFKYNGAISKHLKQPFLTIIDYIEKKPDCAFNCLQILLYKVVEITKTHVIKIEPLKDSDSLTITNIMSLLEEHFLTKYKTHNGAKLPVLAFYSMYKSLLKETSRYNGCKLAKLSSLTACDKTNKASGDIEIFNQDGSLFEAIEIKLDKPIDAQTMRVVKDKVYKWNPKRYYVLSVIGIKETDKEDINNIVNEVLIKHGCQIIINGLLPTIKYYLRLIENLNVFINDYSKAIETDKELQIVHKEKWNQLLKTLNL